MAPLIPILICLLLLLLGLSVAVLFHIAIGELPPFHVVRKTIFRDIRAAYLYFRLMSFLRKCHRRNQSVVDLFRTTAQKHATRVCFVYQDQEWTYQQVDALSNRVANLFLSLGFQKGDEVALLLENCPEYVCVWLGLAKIGVVTAFINTNLRHEPLAHSINVIDARALVFGRSLDAAVRDAIPFMTKRDTLELFCLSEDASTPVAFPAKSLNVLLEDASPGSQAMDRVKVNFQDKLLYIYTSGTTGLPKAAIIRHSRFLWICGAAKYVAQLDDFETFYNPLPLYHTAGGLLFVSVVLVFGGKMVIRNKFSASLFWKEAAKHEATVGQYIGEICRYLLNQPKRPEERQHQVKMMFGNGLRPHIWKDFQDRFNIPRIVEVYGATEGNANLVNMFGKVGAVGFISRTFSKLYPVHLVKVNPETGEPLRDDQGLCVLCKPGEPGEMVGKIVKNNPVNSFDGYVDSRDTKRKIARNCFRKGDTAFLSGDILVMDEEGYLYFVDRTGDTFRWRGENVSTGEVENVVSKALGHVSCVVYGVAIPNVEGRAGMAAVQAEQVDCRALHKELTEKLPPYAVPLFIRICKDIEATGTHKLRKVHLQEQGFNPEDISDPIYFMDANTYSPLTKDKYSDIINGRVRL